MSSEPIDLDNNLIIDKDEEQVNNNMNLESGSATNNNKNNDLFLPEEKNTRLKDAQRKQNDFTSFFSYNKKSVKSQESMESFHKNTNNNNNNITSNNNTNTINSPSNDKQQLSLRNLNDQMIKQKISKFSNGKKLYKKEEQVDQFLNKIIIGRGLTNPEKIDSFLKNSKEVASLGEQKHITQVLHDRYMQDPEYSLHYSFQQAKTNPSNMNTQNNTTMLGRSISNKSLSLSGQQKESSSSFSGPPRFWLSKNKNNTGETKLNDLVAISTSEKHNSQFYDTMINQKPPRYDIENVKNYNYKLQSKKEYENRDFREKDILSSIDNPKNKVKEMRQQKQNMEDYKQWKKDTTYKQKQFQLLKNQYRSGVLSMDSPFVSDSKIYDQEYQKLNQKKQKDQLVHQSRIDNMEKYLMSNPDIDFHNIHKDQHTYNAQHKKQFPHQSHEIDPIWQSRKQGINQSQVLPTFQNCFGHNLADQKKQIANPRSQFLREKDLGGKNFNPLTGCVQEKLF